MNILLWVLQIVVALLCVAGGSYKILQFEQLQGLVAAMRELPKALWMVLGALECLGGLFLIFPGAFKVLPILTPAAAVAVAVESALVSALYIWFGDHSPLPYSLLMAVLAAFIAYGRFARKPF
jgi:uncharacterized membrane protein